MGGKVLELYSEKLLRRGEARGKTEGIVEGEARGRKAGMLATLCSLVKKGLLSVSDAAKELGVSEEAFKKMAML